jgi:hypothetical protein
MRKLFWILIFAAAGYLGFRYFTEDRTLKSPRGLATAFARALISNDAPAQDRYVQGQAKKDLPRIRSRLKSLPQGPATQFRLTSGAGNTSGGIMAINIGMYNDHGQMLVIITAFMRSAEKTWQIEHLAASII